MANNTPLATVTMPRGRSRASMPGPGGIASAVLAVTLSACSGAAKEDPRTLDRIVLTETARPAGETLSAYSGVISAKTRSDLGFRVTGKVTERLVNAGQTVRRGQPLMRIDATDYKNAITVQAGNVAGARARWIQADADERRYRPLVASGAVAQTVYAQTKATAEAARAALASAEAQRDISKNEQRYTLLVADSDGTIVETLAEPGQVVAPGQPVIRLARSGPREALINLPESSRPVLGSTATATLGVSGPTVAARLRLLSDSADPVTRTYEARYVLSGAGASAPLGSTVTLRLSGRGATGPVQVPLGAIDDRGSGTGVWRIDPTLHVGFVPVSVLSIGGELAVVNGQLHADQKVVAAGGRYLHSGQRIRIASSTAAMQ